MSHSKQTIIDQIIKDIELGAERGSVIAKYCKKLQKSARTVDTLWKKANEQHRERRELIKTQLAALDTEKALEARKKEIMTAEDRKEYLTRIIKGELRIAKAFVIAGEIVEHPAEPDAGDRLKAIAELNKMEGDYAPANLQVKAEVKSTTGITLNLDTH